MIILGIDPGIATTGYGVLQKNAGEYVVIDFGTITTPAGLATADRLCMIRDDLESVIKKYQPDASAVEELFFKNNAKTAITVAHARGVILETLQRQGVQVFEFTPLEVKMAVTGSGAADKTQVQRMLQMTFNWPSPPKQDDAADALAIALCLGQCWAQLNLIK